jgi:hypothetical protein
MWKRRFIIFSISLLGAAGFAALVACSSDTTPVGGIDAGQGDGTTQSGDAGGGGPDAGTDSGGSGAGQHGDPCDAGSQCASGVCFMGGATIGGDGGGSKAFCSLYCDAASQCPNPPFTSCNGRGYCRIP